MIHLIESAKPSLMARQKLRRWQADIDRIPSYADRVDEAKKKFESRNEPHNATFQSVRDALSRMCSGARRCCYCEDSVADEVEHIRPKSLYPEVCFAWHNYLYACGPCNGPKNDKFAVLFGPARIVLDVARKRHTPIVPPPPGDPAIIDPRREDPLSFLFLDLLDTFWFSPVAARGTEEFERAEYTIKTLRLNIREYLPWARAQAYNSYRARLKEYIADRDGGAPRSQLTRIIRGIQTMDHPTVWAEMKRQHDSRKLRALFSKAPEARGW
jgi:5-methylcytosine-specific restriction endonuclease McrA